MVIASETPSDRKPGKFEYIQDTLGAEPDVCLMVGGHSDTGILGAKGAPIDQALFNLLNLPHQVKPTYTVGWLCELRGFL